MKSDYNGIFSSNMAFESSASGIVDAPTTPEFDFNAISDAKMPPFCVNL